MGNIAAGIQGLSQSLMSKAPGSTGSQGTPTQGKILTKNEIRKLEDAGFDVHAEKGGKHTVGSICISDPMAKSTGLDATKAWRVGDPVSTKGDRAYQFDGWMRSTGYEPCADIEKPLERLLEELRPVHSVFVDLIREHGLEAEVSIVIKVTSDEIPATTITGARIAEIAALKAGLDIDIILMS